MLDIGKRIKYRRLELGWTQEELASRMGYKTKSTINKIECGKNDVTQSNIVKFANVLKVSVAYLMGWEEEKEKFTLGKTLKQLRTSNNASLLEIAEEMHITVEDLQHYENGTKKVPFEILKAFANYYNISVSDIIGVQIGDDENSHTTITQNERLVRLKLKWEEEIGYNNLTDDEIDKVIEYAKFLVSQRKEKE